jgi:hypothetical protein
LSDKLKAAFPQTSPVLRPEVTFNEITDPAWVAGSVDGELVSLLIITNLQQGN